MLAYEYVLMSSDKNIVRLKSVKIAAFFIYRYKFLS